MIIKPWIKLSFLYFLIVALIGVFLRLLFIVPIDGVNFNNFLHAHSHVAMLGWIFNLLFIGLLHSFVPDKIGNYKWLFWLVQISVLGMLISFPFQGYAAVSISFSTMHILLSWWFGIKFLKDIDGAKSIAHSFARWAIIFMMISNIGPFGLGAAMAQGDSASEFAKLSLYYYLHFQYNGWFTFGVFALFFKVLQENNITYKEYLSRDFLCLMVITCILGFSLSTLWLQPDRWVFQLGYLSAGVQLIFLLMISAFLYKSYHQLKKIFPKPAFAILLLSFIAFAIKIIMQFASAFPEIAKMTFNARNFVIGYLHIVFLGFISFFLIAWLLQQKIVQIKSPKANWGLWLFLIGFVGSEIIIFCQPLFLMMGWGTFPFGYELLFWISTLMPAGIFVFYRSSYGKPLNLTDHTSVLE